MADKFRYVVQAKSNVDGWQDTTREAADYADAVVAKHALLDDDAAWMPGQREARIWDRQKGRETSTDEAIDALNEVRAFQRRERAKQATARACAARPLQTFRTFATAQAARDYRYQNGTGGWIFAPDSGGNAILFPPDMTPSSILEHPLTKGSSGKLLSN